MTTEKGDPQAHRRPSEASQTTLPVHEVRVLTLFPALARRTPAHAKHFLAPAGACLIEGVTTVAAETARAWALAGRAPGDAPDGTFVAALRMRQTDEVFVAMKRGRRSFVFLDKCASPWTDPLADARAALDEALRRWDQEGT